MIWVFNFPCTDGPFYPDCVFEPDLDQAAARCEMHLAPTFGKHIPGVIIDPNKRTKDPYASRLNRWFRSLPEHEQQHLRAEMGEAECYSDHVWAKLYPRPPGRYDRGGPSAHARPVITEHDPPRSIFMRRYYKKPADLFLGSGLLAVSPRLKNVIERFDRDAHRFLPTQLIDPFAASPTTPFFILVPGAYPDTFRPDLSASDAFTRHEGYSLYTNDRSPAAYEGLAFSRAAAQGVHFWSELRFTSDLFCLSGELKAAIDAAGLRIPKAYGARSAELMDRVNALQGRSETR